MDDVLVRKLNHLGEETWRYTGRVIERGQTWVRLEALFNREDMPFHEIVLGKGDRFLEMFYTDRWYNVFEIHDRSDGSLKGWYCNVGKPAHIQDGEVAYIDLALDLLVYPDGRQLILDEDEYAELPLSKEERESCRQALAELQASFQKKNSAAG